MKRTDVFTQNATSVLAQQHYITSIRAANVCAECTSSHLDSSYLHHSSGFEFDPHGFCHYLIAKRINGISQRIEKEDSFVLDYGQGSCLPKFQ
ncbi:hypothetical protein M378DRAFT_739859 [Amanita muscaria Koide BX008]|uniref:Uncharacterized protein n=1 Tax=Amanita muscaria (strain Koide BX008) TaxID=946122 RepID=A0A0C2SMV3_AMAMK|nr:hypothetical protein M378DRAFT_639759 [Amanita muscaria Koide BX008]KIL62929.1 hypothetical protein M378DRAFT_739859 [Amanita muscaria Koide BX008]